MKKYLIIFIILIQSNLQAQNLVQNPSFEELNWCPAHYHDFQALKDCFYAINGSPYVLNSCANNATSNAGVPLNLFGYQYAHTGIGYSGQTFIYFQLNLLDSTLIDSTLNGEIFGMSLKNFLVHGNHYCCSFFVVNANRYSNISIDAISMLLINDSLPEPHGDIPEDSVLKYHPQINNPSGNIIDDTVNWIKIEGEFIAQGGEKYLYIGSFKHLNETHWKFIKPSEEFRETTANYFVDDVSVYPCDAPVYFADAGKDTCISSGESVVLGSPGREEYLYWWSDGKRGIGNSGSITVSPTQTTTYYLVQKDFKFDETRDSVTVRVGNCNGSPDYSGEDFEIFPNPNNGNFQVRFNTSIPDGAILQLHDMLGRIIGEYKLDGSGNTASLNIEVAQAIYCATVIIPNVFKKSVKIVVVN